MNEWSRSRQRLILLIVMAVVVLLIGAPIFLIFYRAPTCFDSKLNGDETGIDCGGSCQLLCTAESLPLIVKGDPRVLTIASSTYEVIALIQNPNTQGEIDRAQYIMRLYGAQSLTPIKVLEGETFVPKGTTFALFVPPFTIEDGSVPMRATLEWKRETLVWQKNTAPVPELLVKNNILSRQDTTPRLTALVKNLSLEAVSNIDLVALISDAEGNVFAASKTIVDRLQAGEETQIIFTWPRPFVAEAVGIDVYIRILPE